MSVLTLLITACAAPIKALKPGEPCPVTPSEPATTIDGISPIAGKYPIWLNVPEEGHFLWQNMGLFLPPPEGRDKTKQFWAIADDIQGKVRITGNQLDGNGIVLFPKPNSVEWVNDTTYKYIEKPLDTLIIDTSSSNGRVTSPKPKGYTYFGSDMIYPHPGCYQFTASIDKNTVNIVVEILDK
jgi:hypothetical protein